MIKKIPVFFAIIFFLGLSCKTPGPVIEKGDDFIEPDKYNVRFISFEEGIDNPENDRMSFYKIFIDKNRLDENRTNTGLESQEKYFEIFLEPNRHLIEVEKWVLDEEEGKYIKLNNIDQPKPSFIYFDVPDDRVVIITMITVRDGTATYSIDLARK